MSEPIMLIQGGGEGAHDEWDDKLVDSLSVHLFHGLADEEVPPAHVDLYARLIPRAQGHLMPGRDHQLANDLPEVAAVIRALREPA